jgi:hypothetical protein
MSVNHNPREVAGLLEERVKNRTSNEQELVFDPTTGDLIAMPVGRNELVSCDAVIATQIADDGFFSRAGC